MRWIALGVLLVIASVHCGMASAEQGVLVLKASTLADRPLKGLVLTTMGDGGMGPPTDDLGKTRIRLGGDAKPGSPVKLLIANSPGGKEMMFISPWNGEVIVPCFENAPNCVHPVWLTDTKNKEILRNGKALAATTERVNHATIAKELEQRSALSETQRRAVLVEQAKTIGLPPDDVDRAIRASGAQTKPASYQKGLAAIYERRYADASQHIRASLQPADRGMFDKHVSLGWSEYRQRHYELAKETLLQAQMMRPEDRTVLEILSRVYRALKDFPNARLSMEKVVALGPATAGVLYDLAIMQKNDQRLDLALRSLEKAKTISGNKDELANIEFVIAGYLIHAGQRQEGLRRFESIKDQLGADRFAGNLAWFYAVAGREQEFFEALERALRVRTLETLLWIDQEVDIDKYREHERFKALVARYPRQ